MTVREVVMLAAEELRIASEVAEYFDGASAVGKEKAELLLTCFNVVENELALDYVPVHAEEKISSVTGEIQFSQLKNSPVRILQVSNTKGETLEFSLFPKYLKTQKGVVYVSYTYTPATKTINDESDFSMNISSRLMAYGIAAEYAMAMGEFAESSLWDKKYKDAIEAAYQMKSGGKIAARRWA